MNNTNRSLSITKANHISSTLRHAIIFGDLKPGEKITENRISKKFKTSHIPVREALKQLEREGFIESKPYSGNNVRRTSEHNLAEYNTIHKIFIRNFLKLAVSKYSESEYKKFDEIIKRMEKSRDYREASLMMIELNELLYEPVNMPYMSLMLKKLLYDNLIYLSIYFKEISKGTINTDDIKSFLKLCKKRKTKEAVSFWLKTQDLATKVLINHFKKEQKEKFFM